VDGGHKKRETRWAVGRFSASDLCALDHCQSSLIFWNISTNENESLRLCRTYTYPNQCLSVSMTPSPCPEFLGPDAMNTSGKNLANKKGQGKMNTSQ
jgi:hypothetical protein